MRVAKSDRSLESRRCGITNLFSDGKFNTVVALAELQDLVVRSGFLFAELLQRCDTISLLHTNFEMTVGSSTHIAREPKHLKSLRMILGVQCLQT
jgi:hypothetical protein